MITFNWNKVESREKPATLDTSISSKNVYIRKNIQEVVEEDAAGEEYTKYVYDETILTVEEYENFKLIQEINNEDSSAAYLEYKAKLDTAIEYPANGHLYKPKWAEEVYAGLIQKGVLLPSLFPMLIWDATEKEENAVNMTIEDLTALSLFLATKQEEYFKEYKKAKKEALGLLL